MNEKEQLISNVETARTTIDELYKKEKAVIDYMEKIEKSKPSISRLIVTLIVFSPLSIIIAMITHGADLNYGAVTLAIWAAFWVYMATINKRKMNRKLCSMQDELDSFAELKLSWLPPQYRNTYDLSKITELVQYNRVNSLREALDILDREEQTDQMRELVMQAKANIKNALFKDNFIYFGQNTKITSQGFFCEVFFYVRNNSVILFFAYAAQIGIP